MWWLTPVCFEPVTEGERFGEIGVASNQNQMNECMDTVGPHEQDAKKDKTTKTKAKSWEVTNHFLLC